MNKSKAILKLSRRRLKIINTFPFVSYKCYIRSEKGVFEVIDKSNS